MSSFRLNRIGQARLVRWAADETHLQEDGGDVRGQQDEIAGVAVCARQEVDLGAQPIDQDLGKLDWSD